MALGRNKLSQPAGQTAAELQVGANKEPGHSSDVLRPRAASTS